jgi:hypothetical protein
MLGCREEIGGGCVLGCSALLFFEKGGFGFYNSSSFLPIHFATTGVSATVGGNLTGLSALCAAYAMAVLPMFSLVSVTGRPREERREGTSKPEDTRR